MIHPLQKEQESVVLFIMGVWKLVEYSKIFVSFANYELCGKAYESKIHKLCHLHKLKCQSVVQF